MMTFLGTVHLLACIGLVILAIIQDSKGGGMFSSQTSSNSVLGATGGASLAVTMTKVLSVLILVTCIAIAMVYTNSNKSVVDGSVMGTSTSATTPTTVPPAQPVMPAVSGSAGAPPPNDKAPIQQQTPTTTPPAQNQ